MRHTASAPWDRWNTDAREYVLTLPSQKAFCESGGPNNTVRCI